jgi:hypothetical protein
MVGGPVGGGEILRPTVGYTVSYGSLHGYLEAYGTHLEQVAAKHEIATAAQGPALMTADVPARAGGPDRILFAQVMPVAKLPPGEYLLRAIVTSSGQPLKTLTRRFEIAPPRGVDDVSRRGGTRPADEHRVVPAGRRNGAHSVPSGGTTPCGPRS